MPKGLVSLSVSLSSSTNLQDMILLCLLHSLQIYVYIDICSQKIISWKFLFQWLPGPLFENSWKFFLWPKPSSPLAEQERLSLARTSRGLPKRTNTPCDSREWLRHGLCAPCVTGDPSPTPSKDARRAARSSVHWEGTMPFSTSADFMSWHGRHLQKGKPGLDCHESSKYWGRTYLLWAMWLRAAPALGHGAVHLSQRSAQMGGTDNQCSGVLGGGATVWLGQSTKMPLLKQKCSWALHGE